MALVGLCKGQYNKAMPNQRDNMLIKWLRKGVAYANRDSELTNAVYPVSEHLHR